VLSDIRTRLISGGAEELLLETMLALLREEGLLKAQGRQRTDATHVLASIRVLTRLVLLGETLLSALNELAELAPDWLRALENARVVCALRETHRRLSTAQSQNGA
jgi:transposase